MLRINKKVLISQDFQGMGTAGLEPATVRLEGGKESLTIYCCYGFWKVVQNPELILNYATAGKLLSARIFPNSSISPSDSPPGIASKVAFAKV